MLRHCWLTIIKPYWKCCKEKRSLMFVCFPHTTIMKPFRLRLHTRTFKSTVSSCLSFIWVLDSAPAHTFFFFLGQNKQQKPPKLPVQIRLAPISPSQEEEEEKKQRNRKKGTRRKSNRNLRRSRVAAELCVWLLAGEKWSCGLHWSCLTGAWVWVELQDWRG